MRTVSSTRPERGLRLTPLALAACLSLVWPSVMAQTAPAPAAAASGDQASDKNQLQTITITANKRAEAAHRVPYNVTALSEEELRDKGITDIKKLIADIPSISAPGNSARFADSVTVRGLNVSSVSANNIEQFIRSTIAYYLDDTLLPHIGYRIKDVERVETLLGPQGTLYGAGSLGGTIRYLTNKPQFGKTNGRLSTEFYQTRHGGLSNDTDGVVNLPLGKDLALRVSLARLDEKGYTDRLSNPPWRTGVWTWATKPDANRNLYEDDDWQRVNTGRVALRWRLTPALETTFTYAQQSQLAHGTSAASLTPLRIANATTPAQIDAAWRLNQAPCTTSCAYTDRLATPYVVNDHTFLARYPEFADRDFKLASFDLDWDLGFARLHSNTSQFKDSRTGQADYASQGNAFYNWFTSGNIRRSNNSLYMTFDNTYEGLSHETRLTSTGNGPLSWIAGIYFAKQDRNWKFDEIFPGIDRLAPEGDFFGIDRAALGGATDSGYAENLGSRYREQALFGEITYAITPQWKVMAGGRFFGSEDKGSAFIIDYAGGLADTNTTSSAKESGRSYFKLNTAYQFTPDLLGYLTYSQGFRRGGTNAFRDFAAQGRVVAPETQTYGPDTTNNIEAGVKGFLLNRQLYLQASVYQIDWKNVQTYYSQGLPDPFGLGIDFPLNGTTNGPSARSRGLELAARLRLGAHWQFSFSSAMTDAEWTGTRQRCTYVANNRPGDADDPDGPDCRVWSAGGALGGAPKWSHRLGVTYNTTLFKDIEMSASLAGRRVSSQLSDRSDDPAATPPFVYPAYSTVDANVNFNRGPWTATLWVKNLSDTRALVSLQGQSDTILGPRLFYTTPRTLGVGVTYRFD